MADDPVIPLLFDTGGSAVSVQQLQQAIAKLMRDVQALTQALRTAEGVSTKALGQQLKGLQTLQRALETADPASTLEAQARQRGRRGRIARETRLQELEGRTPLSPSRIATLKDERRIEQEIVLNREREKRLLVDIGTARKAGTEETARNNRAARELEQTQKRLLALENQLNLVREKNNQQLQVQRGRARFAVRRAIEESAEAEAYDAATRPRRIRRGVARGIERLEINEQLATDPGAVAARAIAEARRRRERIDSTTARLQDQLAGLQTPGAGRAFIDLNLFRQRLTSQATLESFLDPNIVALRNQLGVARAGSQLSLRAALRSDQAYQAGLTAEMTANRIMNMQREAVIRSNPQIQALEAQSTLNRFRLNAAYTATAYADPIFGASKRDAGVSQAYINQAVQDALLADPAYQSLRRAGAPARAAARLASSRAVAESPVGREEDAFIRERRQSILFGDGGSMLFGIQARLLAHYTVLNQVYNAYRAAASAVVDFDNSLRQLQAISQATSGEMERLSGQIVGISRETRFSAVEIAGIATVMAQAGLSVREIEGSLKAVALLATATGSELKESADVFTSAIGVYNLRTEESINVTNQMVAALNLSKLTMDKLALGMQYVSNVAAQAGIDFTEMTAGLSVLSNSGIRSGSTLGTGFRQLIIDLTAPTDKLKARLNELGLSMADLDFRTKGLEGVLRTLHDAGFTSADALQFLQVRAANAFSAFSRNIDEIGRFREALLLSDGAAEANAVQMTSLANRAIQLQNNINALAITLTGPFMVALKTIVTGLADAAKWASQWETVLTVLGTVLTAAAVTWLVKFLAGLVGINFALETSSARMAQYATGMTVAGNLTAATTGKVTLLSRAFAALLSPLALGTLALTALIGLLAQAGSASEEHAEALRKAKEAVNEVKGEIDAKNRSLATLDEFLNSVVSRSSNLAQNERALAQEVLTAKNRFGDLDAGLHTHIGTVSELIDKLNRLRNTLNEATGADLVLFKNRVAQQMELLRGEIARASESKEIQDLLGLFGVQTGVPSRVSPEDLAADPSATYTGRAFLSATNIDPRQVRGGQPVADALRLLTSGNPSLDALNAAITNLGPLLQSASGEDKRNLQRLVSMLAAQRTRARDLAVLGLEQQGADDRLVLSRLQGSETYKLISENLQNLAAKMNLLFDLNAVPDLETRQTRIPAVQAEVSANLRRHSELVGTLPEDLRRAFLRTPAASQFLDLEKRVTDFDKEIAQNAQARAGVLMRLSLDELNVKLRSLSDQARDVQTLPQYDRLIEEYRKQREEWVRLNMELWEPPSNMARNLSEVEKVRFRELAERQFRDEFDRRLEDMERGRDRFFGGSRFDPRTPEYSRLADQRLARINRIASIGEAAAAIPLKASQAALESFRLRPELVPEAYIFARRRATDELEASTAEEQRRVQQQRLHDLSRLSVEQQLLRIELEEKINKLRAAGVGAGFERGEMGTRATELRDLERQNERLADSIRNIGVAAEDAKTKIEQYNEIIAARRTRPEVTYGEVIDAVGLQFKFEQGLLDSGQKQIGDSLTEFLRQGKDDVANYWNAWVTGAAQGKLSFADFGRSLLATASKIATNKIASLLLGTLFDLVGSGVRSVFGLSGGAKSNFGPTSFRSGVEGLGHEGGHVYGFNSGGRVPGVYAGRDTVRVGLAPGEHIVNRRGVSLVGTQFLDDLNRGAVRATGSSRLQPMPKREPDVVNVYAVAPEAMPSLGPKDVIAVIGQDIAIGGNTKKLIKSVVVGAI